MDKIGIGFLQPDGVRLSSQERCLDVDFRGSEVRRVVMVEPEVRRVLPVVMRTTYNTTRIAWAELRGVLEEHGVSVRPLIARNMRTRPRSALV